MRWTAAIGVAAIVALAGALVALAVLPDVAARAGGPVELSYPDLQAQVADGNVTSVTVRGDELSGDLRRPAGDDEATAFTSVRPSFAQDDLLGQLDDQGVPWIAEATGGGDGGGLATLAAWLLPVLVIGGIMFLVLRGSPAARGASSFGRARTRRYEPSQEKTTFADVAGIDDVAAELQEVVRFLRDPEPYRRLGAAMPRGVLLFGPPGTGKTLIARAVAGEAGVPFFSLSASEFVEMFVGVGASRVRDLFAQAKEAAPSIVFIDELDAIGRVRSRGTAPTSNDEREQTLNQILAELDGFTGAEGVVVIAATNRPEILDPALLRAGRFDRRVSVNPPDRPGREAILRVHTRDVPLEDDVDLAALAAATPGMVGADLRTLVNEGALMAAARGHGRVTRADLSDALEKVLLGAERRVVITPEERMRTAYHEAGHALVASLVPGADAVRKVSIVPHGQALGVTLQSPREERHGYTAGELRGRIVAMLGGRAAEALVLQEPTTGAEDDLLQATALARRMIGRWGMSDVLGPVSVTPDESLAEAAGVGRASEETRRLVDREVRRLVDSCEREARDLLGGHREALERLAAALLARETLEEDEIVAVLAGAPDAPPAASPLLPEASPH